MKQIYLLLLLVPTLSIASDWQSFPLRENGTIPLWTVLGPFPNNISSGNDAGLYQDYLVSAGGEKSIIPSEGDLVKTRAWKTAFSDNSGLLDYIRIFGVDKETPYVAYAFCQLFSKQSRTIKIKLRSDDGVRLWLNGKLIHDYHDNRSLDEGEDHLIVKLNKGNNKLLIKVDQGVGDWGLMVFLSDIHNNTLEDVVEKVALEKPIQKGLISAKFSTSTLVMKKNNTEILPIEVNIMSGGLEKVICRFKNQSWTTSQDIDLGDLPIGRHKLDLNLKIPSKPTVGSIRVDIYASDVQVSDTSWLLKLQPPGDLFLRNPKLYVFPSSHQDIAWMNSPQQCIEDRDKLIISPALELLKNDPDYHYEVEDALILMEYLERNPGRKEEIQKYTREGRLLWGGTYTQPYESLYSGESLVRQMYFGRKLIKQVLPGCDTRVASSPDVPGRAMQIPQILHKAGIKYLVFSRFGPGIYDWKSPDGSGVIAYSPGHYHHQSDFIRQTNLKVYLDGLDKLLLKWESFYPENITEPVIPVLSSTDMEAPLDFSGLEKQLKENMAGKIYTENGIIQQIIPTPEYTTSQKALDMLMSTKPQLPVISGERPNVWLYIHGPTHHKAVTACREAAVFLPAAEKFNTVSSLLKNDMTAYPDKALRKGWEGQVYPDHGWGGYNGQLTDNLFWKKFKLARNTGEKYLGEALTQIAGQINADLEKGKPLVIFNDLSWARTDAVRQELTFNFGEAFSIAIKDGVGKDVPHQIIASELNADGSLKSAEISFIAKDIPSIGYKTYFVQTFAKKLSLQSIAKTPENFENDFYKISFAPGGIKQIFDKQASKNLLITDKFLAGEIFTMRSQGNGAGEFAEVQQPTMEGFDKVSNYKPNWKLNASGQVCDIFSLEQKLKHCTIKQTVTIYHSIKQIDFGTEIVDWDGTEYREFRQAFPLDKEGGEVAYDVAFGKVRVGKDEIDGAAGERYVQPCSDVHPREVQNWISVGNNDFSVTLSSDVAVCDWIDPTDNPVKYPVLQPILFASRRSCHGYGNWYLQQGNHSYRFSLFSEKQNQLSYRKATGVNHPFRTILISESNAQNKELPMEHSFVSCDKPNVVISAIKKCEDDDSIILRCYETDGKDTDVTINFFKPLKSAEHTNIIEEEGKEIKLIKGQLKVHLGHNAIETFKLMVN